MRRGRRLAVVGLCALVLLLPACAPRPEQAILDDFFAKSQARDTVGLQRFATVIFDPSNDGTMTSFSIRDVVSTRRPLSIGGELLVKDVVIDARVRTPAGDNVRKRMIVRLQQALPNGVKEAANQWVVAQVLDAPASP